MFLGSTYLLSFPSALPEFKCPSFVPGVLPWPPKWSTYTIFISLQSTVLYRITITIFRIYNLIILPCEHSHTHTHPPTFAHTEDSIAPNKLGVKSQLTSPSSGPAPGDPYDPSLQPAPHSFLCFSCICLPAVPYVHHFSLLPQGLSISLSLESPHLMSTYLWNRSSKVISTEKLSDLPDSIRFSIIHSASACLSPSQHWSQM